MASKRPHQPGGTEETKKTRQDEAEASVTGADAGPHMDDDSDVHVNASAQDGGNVNAPAFSQNTFQGSFKYNPSVHHHYGAATSTSAPQPAHKSDTASIIAEYKTSVQSSYEEVKEYNSRPFENVLLSKRYTELHMVESHRKQEEREEEIRSRGEHLQEILKRRSSEAYSPITVEQLFRPDSRGCVPKAVILQGHPGYGKSFTAQFIMLDWASRTLYKDLCHLVLHLECKEINEISGECSLVDLLRSPSFTGDTEDVLRDPKIKVLFLVDGFDELKFSFEGASSPLPKDPFTKAPVEVTLKALLKGHILPQCKLLLTTRSTATSTLSCLVSDRCVKRFVDILGFTKEAVKDYFHKFFTDEHKADALLEYVRDNETLYTSCFIPFVCWVTCTVFQAQELKGAHITKDLETNTSIYANFVSILLEHHSRSLNLPVPVLLSSLGRLAEKGMKENCVLFTKKDVESTVSHLKTGPFLCEFIQKTNVRTEEMFSFMHLSFQEFFTALHYTLDQDGEKLRGLLDSYTHNSWQSHRQPVIQFLFGLANKTLMENLDDLQLKPNTSSIRSDLERWIMKGIQHVRQDSRDKAGCLFLLSCLTELHEEEFVGKVMHDLGTLSFQHTPLTRMDFWVLRYCLLCCPTETPFEELVLYQCALTADMLRMLQPALSRCQTLRLDLEAVADDDIWTFLSTLMRRHKLQELSLDVQKNSLVDVGEFISSLADKHILTGQRFELCLYFMSGRTMVLLPEASQSMEHLKTVGKADLSVYNPSSSFEGADSDDDQDVDANYDLHELFSCLVRIPGLKEAEIKLKRCLNQGWKYNVLSLVNDHPTLQRLKLEFTYLDDYVMEPKIKPTEITRPDCTVIIQGVQRACSSIKDMEADYYDPGVSQTNIFRKNFFSWESYGRVSYHSDDSDDGDQERGFYVSW